MSDLNVPVIIIVYLSQPLCSMSLYIYICLVSGCSVICKYMLRCSNLLMDTGIILCVHPANERWRYSVAPSLIGWAHTQNDPYGYKLSVGSMLFVMC